MVVPLRPARLFAALLLCACVPGDPPEGPARRAGNAIGPSRSHHAAKPAEKSRAVALAAASADAVVASPLRVPFHDAFERDALGPSYRATSAVWRLADGRLCARGAHNHPVWLRAALPENARIEFDARSASSDGDIKAEAWGDGQAAATTAVYGDATSYLFIFGGWKNSLHVLARLDEHGVDRRELRLVADSDDPQNSPVEANRDYHVRIERRDGKTVAFSVDDIEILSLVDPAPLRGPGHEYFAFNDWETPVCFDNLDISPFD